MKRLLRTLLSLALASTILSSASAAPAIFARTNLVAWCIVPFDAKKRGPAERAEMAAKLGFKHIAYDWRQALGGFDVAPRAPDADLASGQAVQGVLDHWEQALTAIGFLDPKAPKKLMPRLNQLFNRAQLRQEEIHILRGIARAMQKLSPAQGKEP